MKLLYLLFLIILETYAGNVEVDGVISLQLVKPISELNKIDSKVRKKISKNVETPVYEEGLLVRGHKNSLMTVAPVVECTYQIPEETQVQALLSNMMNQLTKMFVNAHEIMNEDSRRRGEKRFRVISKKQTDFFESIYSNMTQQYLKLYNSTTVRVDRTERQKYPCENQEEMKEIWKDLIDNSLTTFRQAAFRCIDENLKANRQSDDLKVRKKMAQYLLRELRRIKMSQLEMLCDTFQLCFNDLVRRNNIFY